MNIEFYKYEGAGNDFILIDQIDEQLIEESIYSGLSQTLCRPKLGIGADGLLILEADTKADFRMRIINSDGSEAEMCGNGARCCAAYYFKKSGAKRVKFETMAGVMYAEAGNSDTVILSLPSPGAAELDVLVELDSKEVSLSSINTGVPHAVVETERLEEVDVNSLGRMIRYNEKFAPAGTNANFVKVTGPSSLRVRTYERGVESETLACGTGVIASAVVESLKGRVEPPVKVVTSGGDEMTVHFDIRSEDDLLSRVGNVKLEGHAKHVFSGNLEI